LIQAQTREHLERRHATQPYHLPSCGSVFRNPEPQKAAWLIEQSGLKGRRIGGAEVAQMHANFILNRDNATATDIFNLIDYVRNEVYHRWDVLLEPEVRMLGQFCAA
jgi:UDP-N-acetylmuramate dehydrogenase